MRAILIAAVLTIGLSACEKSQTTTARKPDSLGSEAAQNPFVVPGWKSGDNASWEAQLRNRTNGQNEYTRVSRRQ